MTEFTVRSTIEESTPSDLPQSYVEGLERSNSLIDPDHQRSQTLAEVRDLATRKMNRLEMFLELIENPQRNYPIVHVAGTSGKGSTATSIASILTSAGYRTGLHTSPYLQVATEKLQIDRQLVSAGEFESLVRSTIELFEESDLPGPGDLTYGELWVAMAFRWFRESEVDIAVIETGAGGRFDLTNLVVPVLSVITTIGLDHTATLGATIEEIAWHKAGILKPGVPAVATTSESAAMEVIEQEARDQGVPLDIVNLRDSFQNLNADTAIRAVEVLNRSGFGISDEAIEDGIDRARIQGRIETVQVAPNVILDGAHNQQKLAALTSELLQLQPVIRGARRVVVVGILESKNLDSMLTELIPIADEFICTAESVPGKHATDPAEIATILQELGFAGPIEIEQSVSNAVDLAMKHANDRDAILVTGSIYVVGAARRRWYPDGAIVRQQTPWPVSHEGRFC